MVPASTAQSGPRREEGCADPMLSELTGWSLLSGPIRAALTVAVVIGLGVLLLRRGRRWLLVGVPLAGCGAVALAVGSVWIVERVWKPFPDILDRRVYFWGGVAVLAVLLATLRAFFRCRDRRYPVTATAIALSSVVVVIAAAGQINVLFAAYPTLGSILGIPDYRTLALDQIRGTDRTAVDRDPLSPVWEAPAAMPATGAVTTGTIPPTVSRFEARPAIVYLPPAYFAEPRPLLPVLVLLAGVPGGPEDWLAGGRLVETMDSFSAQHAGLAPVVVVADATGTQFGNPACVDSHLGNVDTYLGTDVPNWVKSTFQIDPDPQGWAIGGLSYGGTCSLQLATAHPDIYPTFLDLSGQIEPGLGDHRRTVTDVFAGDEQAFRRINPLDLLHTHRYPDSAGAFVAGSADPEAQQALQLLAIAARDAGMDVHYSELPGGHTFEVWSAGLEKELPWLGRRLAITP